MISAPPDRLHPSCCKSEDGSVHVRKDIAGKAHKIGYPTKIVCPVGSGPDVLVAVVASCHARWRHPFYGMTSWGSDYLLYLKLHR